MNQTSRLRVRLATIKMDRAGAKNVPAASSSGATNFPPPRKSVLAFAFWIIERGRGWLCRSAVGLLSCNYSRLRPEGT